MEELIQGFLERAEGSGGEAWLRRCLWKMTSNGKWRRRSMAVAEQRGLLPGVLRAKAFPPERPAREEEGFHMPCVGPEAFRGEA